MLKLNLRRTVMNSRRAYIIDSVEVDGRKADEVFIRSPDGDFHLYAGDTHFARNFPRLYQTLLESVRDWHGSDILTLDRLPVKKLKLVRLIHPPGRAYRVESINDGTVKSQLIIVPQGDILFEVGDIIPIRDFIRELTEIIGFVEWMGQDTVAIDKLPD